MAACIGGVLCGGNAVSEWPAPGGASSLLSSLFALYLSCPQIEPLTLLKTIQVILESVKI